MSQTLTYLYDPLCGWCYGAMPALSALFAVGDVKIELMPTGLFADQGARPMDDDFAAFAWANDQRIEGMTGQPFTEAYRQSVLADRQQRFDSGPATLALTALVATTSAQEYTALKAIQHARYVQGRDVTSPRVLADLLHSLGLTEAATLVRQPNDDIAAVNQARITRAQSLMREFGARGVPTLVLESGRTRSLLVANTVFSDPHDLINQVAAAAAS